MMRGSTSWAFGAHADNFNNLNKSEAELNEEQEDIGARLQKGSN